MRTANDRPRAQSISKKTRAQKVKWSRQKERIVVGEMRRTLSRSGGIEAERWGFGGSKEIMCLKKRNSVAKKIPKD